MSTNTYILRIFRSIIPQIHFVAVVLLLSGMFSTYAIAQIAQGDPLPPGYTFKNVGEPSGPTIYSYNATTGQYFIDHKGGNGGDTGWGTEDQCCMIYFQTQEDKEVVARLVSIEQFAGKGWNSKAFIMVRSSLDPEAAMIYLELRGDPAAIIDWRPSTGFNNANSAYNRYLGLSGAIDGRWIKLVRQGVFVSAFISNDGKVWSPVAMNIKLKFTGPVYMGIGAAGCAGEARVNMDNFIVRDIINPYQVNGDTIKSLQNINLPVNTTSTFDITQVFGHVLGDAFTIDAVSTDNSVATIKAYQVANPDQNAGDLTLQKLDITALKDGIATIRLSTNLMGYKMSFDLLVTVNGTDVSPVIVPKDPYPWILKDLGITPNPNPSAVMFGTSVTDTLKVFGNQGGGLGADTVTSFYQLFNRTDNVRLTVRVDSVKNTGKGSFAGLMIRDTSNNGSSYVSLSVGAYEGLKFSYRWDNDENVTNIVDKSVGFPCWLMLDYYKDDLNHTYFYPYYSSDGYFWKELMRYPLLLEMKQDKIMAGLFTQGGGYSTTKRKSMGIFNKLSVDLNSTSQIHLYNSLSELKTKMTISPNPISSTGTIRYKVVAPGKVIISVYDVFGTLQDVLFSGNEDVGEYTLQYSPVNLPSKGVYLLRFVSVGDYQTLKFIYQ